MEFLAIWWTSALVMSTCSQALPAIIESRYKVLKNMQFLDTTDEVLASIKRRPGGLIACARACQAHVDCTSLTYDHAFKTCKKNVKDIYTFGRKNITSSKNVHYLGKVQHDITDGDWTMVFRAQVNNSVSMWKSYSNSSYRSDHDMSNINFGFSSEQPDTSLPHFRSRWLDLWPSDAIDQVRVQLFKDGRSDVSMVFNGTGSNQTNWFSFQRLVNISPYTDLTTDVAWFILGRKANKMFFVSNTSDYSSCNQQAWIVAEDLASNRCYWSHRSNWPRILYSAKDHQVNFNDRSQGENVVYRVADILTVFIKFRKQH